MSPAYERLGHQALLEDTVTPVCNGSSFTKYDAATGTVLAKQKSPNTFEKWSGTFDPDYGLYKATDGKKTVDDMFTMLEDENRVITWILRAISLVLTIVGLQLITAPLTVVADIIPLIGPAISGIIGTLLCALNTGVGCCCWMFIAGIIWVAYRPTIGIPLLIVAILGAVAAVGAVVVHKKKQAQRKTAAGGEMKAMGESEAV